MNKNILAIGVIILFIISALAPITFGSNTTNFKEQPSRRDYNFDRYLYPEYYDCYNTDEISNNIDQPNNGISTVFKSNKVELINSKNKVQTLDALRNSPWPMHGHDIRHTGLSPYSTVDTWDEIWNFKTIGWAKSSPAIDKDGTVYIGSAHFYAIHSNGTLKWMYKIGGDIESCCPAIDEDGIIYIGTIYDAANGNHLYAFYPNGTLKWKFYTGGNIFSSPIIGNDGTIYFGHGGGPNDGHINAVYPNGTLRWRFDASHGIYSSPAIGQDGTIYCGSHDNYLYALHPNNGTLKWKFKTGNWVHGTPSIADDGTVYIGSDDGYLYALYPNKGTMKWRCNIGSVYASPALDEDGTLYVGVWEKTFYAIYPNGTIKWTFKPGAKIWGSSAAISKEGTIYFGTCDLEYSGGIEIIALYADGTVKWRKGLDTVFSSPAIGFNGTVYIGSCNDDGYLNAFSIGELEADANGPYYGLINEPVQFEGYSKGGYSPYSYHWDFGDGETAEEQNPSYSYSGPGNYTVTLTVTDNESNTTSDTTYAWIQDGNTPPIQPSIDGPTHGSVGTSYDYTFTSSDPEGLHIWYYIDWGDGSNTGWIGPYGSGIGVTKSHTWSNQGTYTIKCIARDPYNHEGQEGILTVTMPRNKATTSSLFLWFLERFPLLEQLLNIFVGY